MAGCLPTVGLGLALSEHNPLLGDLMLVASGLMAAAMLAFRVATRPGRVRVS